MRKGFALVPVVIILLAVAAFGTLLWLSLSLPVKVTSTVNVGPTFTTNSNTANVNAVENVNAASNVNTTANATAGWKTYTNTKYSFSVQYPADLKVIEPCGTTGTLVTTCASFENSNGSAITAFVHPSADIVGGGWFSAVTITSDTTKTINGSPWRIITTKGSVDGNVNNHLSKSAIHVSNGISISLDLSYTADQKEMIALYDQMLLTLTVINPTAGWKTYTNASMGFSIKHPAGWSIDDTSTPNKVWFNPSGTEIVDSIQVETATQTLKQIYDSSDVTAGSKEYTTIGGQQAVKLSLAEFGLVEFHIVYKGKHYAIHTNHDLKNNPDILATFTFTK